jgi:hypothetical protein
LNELVVRNLEDILLDKVGGRAVFEEKRLEIGRVGVSFGRFWDE